MPHKICSLGFTKGMAPHDCLMPKGKKDQILISFDSFPTEVCEME